MKYQDRISRTISQFIYSQLPATIHLDFEKPVSGKTDRTLFTRFIELYYEFLETSSPLTLTERKKHSISSFQNLLVGEAIDDVVPGLYGELMRLRSYRDIDLTNRDLKDELYKEYTVNYQGEILGDRDRLLKIASLINRTKGTELSYKALFRFFYNSDVKFVEPKTEIFIPSHNRYYRELRMKIREIPSLIEPSLVENFSEFVGKYIKGVSSGAKAYVISTNHDTDIAIKDTAPVTSVSLSSGGSNYKTPGAIVTDSSGYEILKGDYGYSAGAVATVEKHASGSGYSKYYQVELWENSDSSWAENDILLPMTGFDESNTGYSLAGWNVQKGMGKIVSTSTSNGKTYYYIEPQDPEEALSGLGQYWNNLEGTKDIVIEKNKIPVDITIPPSTGFNSLPTLTTDTRIAYQGTIASQTAAGTIKLHSDERKLNLTFDNSTNVEDLYTRTQTLTLVFNGVEDANRDYSVGAIAEQATTGAKGVILEWDNLFTMRVRLIPVSGSIIPFTTTSSSEFLHQSGASNAKSHIAVAGDSTFVAGDIIETQPYQIVTLNSGGTGNFSVGETVSWDQGRVTGVVSKWDSGTRVLHVVKASGRFFVAASPILSGDDSGATNWTIASVTQVNKVVSATIDSVSTNTLVIKDFQASGSDWFKSGDYIKTRRGEFHSFVSALVSADPTLNGGTAKANIELDTDKTSNSFAISPTALKFTDSTGIADSGITGWSISKIYYQLKDSSLQGSSVVKNVEELAADITRATTYGSGTGLTVNITTDSTGTLLNATVQSGGSGYLIGDELYVLSNTANEYRVGGVGGGAVRAGLSGNNGKVIVTGVDSFGVVTSVSTRTTVADNFGKVGSSLPGDVNFDGKVDVTDLALISGMAGSGYKSEASAVATSYGNGSGFQAKYGVIRGESDFEINVDSITISNAGTGYDVDEKVYITHDNIHSLGGVRVELNDVATNSELIIKLSTSTDAGSVNSASYLGKTVTQGSASGTISATGVKKFMLRDITGVFTTGGGFTYDGDAVDWNAKGVHLFEDDTTVDIDSSITAKVVSSEYSSAGKFVTLSTISASFAVGNTLKSSDITGINHQTANKKTHFTVKAIGTYQVANPQNGTRISIKTLTATSSTGVALHGGSGSTATVDYTTDSLGRVSSFTFNNAGKDYKVGDEVTIKSDSYLPATEVGGNATKIKINKIQATGLDAKTYFKQSDGKVQDTASGLTLDYTVTSGAVSAVTLKTAGTGYKEDSSSTGGNVEEVYLVPTDEEFLVNGLNSNSTNAVIKITDTDNIKTVESTDLVLRGEDVQGTFHVDEVIEAVDVDDNDLYISNTTNKLRAKVDPVITGVEIDHGGIGYRVGDEASVLDSSGIGGRVEVSEVTNGPIESLILHSSDKGTKITDTGNSGGPSIVGFSIHYLDVYGFEPTKTGRQTSYADITTLFSVDNSAWDFDLTAEWPSGDVNSNFDKLAIIKGSESGYLGYVIKFENVSPNLYRLWIVEEVDYSILKLGPDYKGERLELSYAFDSSMNWDGGFILNGDMSANEGWFESDLGYTGASGERFSKPVATCYASAIKSIGPRVPQAVVENVSNPGGNGALSKIELIDGGDGYSDFPLVFIYNGTFEIDFGCKIYAYGNDIGSIKDTRILNVGTRYTGNEIHFPQKTVPGGNSGLGYPSPSAKTTLLTGATYKTDDRQVDNVGWSDATQRLQDRLVYNKFAYMLESSVSPEVYLPTIKKTIHPVGFRTTPKYVYAQKPDSHTKTTLKVQVTGSNSSETTVQTTT